MMIYGRRFTLSVVTIIGIVLLLALSIQTTTQADDRFSLATDSNAMGDWQGTKSVSGTLVGGTVSVEYAVYAPGYFDDTFTDWDDPTDGTCYVYAYQLLNEDASNAIKTLTVNIDGNEFAANISEISNLDLTSSFTSSGSQNSTSIVWTFSTAISYGENSNILIFTSLYSPEWDTSSVRLRSVVGFTDGLPSPVPEPSILYGLMVACGLFLARNKLKK